MWTKLNYHEQQAKVWKSQARFINLACGRGSGKTELARRKIVVSLAVKKQWPRPIYFYALPTFMQAMRVAWREILALIPPEWIVEKNVMNLYIRTIFGSELYIVGLDRPERIEGLQYDGGVIDECSDQKPGIFDRSIEPTLTHKEGWCWRIGVPKRAGVGVVDFKTAFDIGLNHENEFGMESYSWGSDTVLSPEKLAKIKERLAPEDYAEQYEASWIKSGGLIYYTFSITENVSPEVTYKEGFPLYIGMDFNVNPMCWVIGQYQNGKLCIFDEIFIRNTNTPECLEELYSRYGLHPNEVIFCGDAASRQRKTSAAASDYALLNNFRGFKDRSLRMPSKNPPIKDRVASTNALIKNANNERRVLINPKCRRLIFDLSNFAYKEGTSIPDTSNPDIGHITDALGYLVWETEPIKIETDSCSHVGIVSFA